MESGLCPQNRIECLQRSRQTSFLSIESNSDTIEKFINKQYISDFAGQVDQLEDRYLGMVEAASSNLALSTTSPIHVSDSWMFSPSAVPCHFSDFSRSCRCVASGHAYRLRVQVADLCKRISCSRLGVNAHQHQAYAMMRMKGVVRTSFSRRGGWRSPA